MPIQQDDFKRQMIRSLATYIWCAKCRGIDRDSCSGETDYHNFLVEYISNDTLEQVSMLFGVSRENLIPLSDITLSQDDYYSLVEQIYVGNRPINVVGLPYSTSKTVVVPHNVSFFNNYINHTLGGDSKTKNAVEETIERMNTLLAARSSYDQRVSGLVVGRVQSGKTRNYVGLMLKAFDEGWNVIIVLTSDNIALAHQTRKRIFNDFTKSQITIRDNRELQFLSNQDILENPDVLAHDDAHFLFWGVAMKEKSNLKRINQWFTRYRDSVEKMRVLIIDDEADNATPDSRANKRNQLTEEELDNLIETLGEEEDERFQNLAYWMISLQDKEFPELPDEEENDNPEQHNYRELRNFLSLTTGFKRTLETLFNSASFREVLNLELRDAEGMLLFDWEAIREYFSQRTGERSPKMLICAINTILEVSTSRSTINKYICTFVDKRQEETEYAFKFQKCAYIGYTATPYACILNEHPDQTALYPDFIRSLEKSPRYFGLEEIFGEDTKMPETNIPNFIPRMPIVRPILEEESRNILHPLQGIKESTGTHGSNRNEQLTVTIDGNLNYICSNNSNGEWKSMKNAIAWAFCTAAARSYYRDVIRINLENDDTLSKKDKEDKLNSLELRWTTMLVNITHKKDKHQLLEEIIKDYLRSRCSNEAARQAFIEECNVLWEQEREKFTRQMFNELFNDPTLPSEHRYGEINNYPTWTQIEGRLRPFIIGWNNDKVHVVVINSLDRKQQDYYTQNPDKLGEDVAEVKGDNLWIICGGNTISRGLTLPGLTVSYFDRVRKTIAVDTMTQMGRWFGYRDGYELLPRLWLTSDTVLEMKKTAVIEDRMHTSMVSNFMEGYSPSDASHYQVIYSFGRKLSGRSHAQKLLTEGFGAFGSTSFFTTENDRIQRIYERTSVFVGKRGNQFIRSKDEYEYAYVPCWLDVSKDAIVNYLEEVKALYPQNSKVMLESLLKEIKQCENSDNWDVVIGTPHRATRAESDPEGGFYRLGENKYLSGRPSKMPRVDATTIRFCGSARLYTSYYAMIPTVDLNKIDVDNLEKNIREIEDIISEKCKENLDINGNETLPANIDLALPLRGEEADWKVRLQVLLRNLKTDSSIIMPKSIHGLFRLLNNGYNDRSTWEYMELVHKQANHTNPILQIYLFCPPEESVATNYPLVSIAFFWPGHSSDDFHANCVGIELEHKNPTERQLFKAIEEILRQNNFPMTTTNLRGSVINRLAGCTERFFTANVRKNIEQRKYAAFPGRDAYYLKEWSPSPEERLQRELLNATLEYLMTLGHPIRRDNLLKNVLLLNPKFKGLFSSRENSRDQALLSRLLTDELLKENGIEIVSQRPLTYQYNPLA